MKGEIVLPPPTWSTLRELEPFESVKDALAWARRRTVVRRMPKAIEQDGHRMLLLPGDPLHPDPAGDDPPLETRFRARRSPLARRTSRPRRIRPCDDIPERTGEHAKNAENSIVCDLCDLCGYFHALRGDVWSPRSGRRSTRALVAPEAAAIYQRLLPQISRIRIFDHHAHPGFAGDEEVDPAPVPEGAMPLRLSPGNPDWAAAGRALWGVTSKARLKAPEPGAEVLQRHPRQAGHRDVDRQPHHDVAGPRSRAVQVGLLHRSGAVSVRQQRSRGAEHRSGGVHAESDEAACSDSVSRRDSTSPPPRIWPGTWRSSPACSRITGAAARSP